MIRTYNETWAMNNEKLQKATVRLYIYDIDKFSNRHTPKEVEENMIEVTYTGLIAWDVIEGGNEAEEIEKDMNDDEMDEHHEYLVLHFNDGTQSTFRNSHVDMFLR